MKILFVSTLYPKESVDLLSKFASGYIQNASNVFQWAVIDGLLKNDVDFDVVSLPALPSFPIKYNKLYTLSGCVTAKGKVIGKMLRYCDLVVYKTFSMRHRLLKYLYDWAKCNVTNGERLVILTYTPYVPFVKAVNKLKNIYPNIILVSIVTDLVDDMMNFKSNQSFLKSIQCAKEIKQTKQLYNTIDKFVLLAKPMIEKIPEARGKSIIIEGIATLKPLLSKSVTKLRVLLYAGTLQEFSCVRDLIQAFRKIPNENFRLVICGHGPLTLFIQEQSKDDTRIIYKGLVPREEVIKLQNEATALINPRKPDFSITRFTFPSKTMEYLSSGTPMIGYKLEGIPEEYYNFFFTVENNNENSLVNTIEKVLLLPQEELDAKAYAAYHFIENQKTAKIQVKKIVDFISEPDAQTP